MTKVGSTKRPTEPLPSFVDGVPTESCEQYGCDINGPSFKGIYVRGVGELDRALKDHPFSDYLVGQTNIAHENARNPDDQYGLHWAGPVEHVSAASQQSAVDLLVAARPIKDAAGSGSTLRPAP